MAPANVDHHPHLRTLDQTIPIGRQIDKQSPASFSQLRKLLRELLSIFGVWSTMKSDVGTDRSAIGRKQRHGSCNQCFPAGSIPPASNDRLRISLCFAMVYVERVWGIRSPRPMACNSLCHKHLRLAKLLIPQSVPSKRSSRLGG